MAVDCKRIGTCFFLTLQATMMYNCTYTAQFSLHTLFECTVNFLSKYWLPLHKCTHFFLHSAQCSMYTFPPNSFYASPNSGYNPPNSGCTKLCSHCTSVHCALCTLHNVQTLYSLPSDWVTCTSSIATNILIISSNISYPVIVIIIIMILPVNDATRPKYSTNNHIWM